MTEQTDEQTPRRMTLSRVLELLLTRPSSESYVTLGRNAAGDTTIDVRVTVDGSDGASTPDEAKLAATALYDELRERYPLSPSGEPASVELTRNAKGETQIDLQVRGRTALAALADQATEAYQTLRARFPLASGHVGAPTGAGKEGTS